MKSTKEVKGKGSNLNSGDSSRKVTKLVPIKKNGKESRVVYDEEEDSSTYAYKKRDSILDYYDEGDDE